MVMVQIMDTEITTYNVVSSLTGEVLKRFSHRDEAEEFTREAEFDVMENSRKRSEYSINKVRDEGNGLVSYIFDMNERSIRGKQHGESIENYMLDCIV